VPSGNDERPETEAAPCLYNHRTQQVRWGPHRAAHQGFMGAGFAFALCTKHGNNSANENKCRMSWVVEPDVARVKS